MSHWGSTAPNPHEGGRSEYYALLAFSSIGTSVPVPRQEDNGLDLYCTLTEGDSKRTWAYAYYGVQVRSYGRTWNLNHERSVRALIQVPLPLFLCIVKKKEQRLLVYHTSPRFYVWAYPPYPSRMKLLPGEPGKGVCTQWGDGEQFHLSAPILDFRVEQIEDKQFRKRAAGVLKYWIDVDEDNLQLMRHGLRSFKMPDRYETNELPSGGRVSQSSRVVSREDLARAVSFLRPPLDGVSQQLFRHDLLSAVRGMLLLRQLYWDDCHAPQALGFPAESLNKLFEMKQYNYLYEAIDSLASVLDLAILRSLEDRVGEHLYHVQRLYLTGKQVSDGDLALLKSTGELKRLELIGTGITDAGLKHITNLTTLRYLSLTGAQITDKGLRSLSKLVELRNLTLSGTKVTSEGVAYIGTLTKLAILDLSDTKVDDEGLESLGRLPELELLFLDGTLITDRGLEYLRSSPKLRRIGHQRTQITDLAYEALEKKLPGWIEYQQETERLMTQQKDREAGWSQCLGDNLNAMPRKKVTRRRVSRGD
jgi:hypothetical protein